MPFKLLKNDEAYEKQKIKSCSAQRIDILRNLLCLKKSEVFSPIFRNCFAVSDQVSEATPKSG